MRTPYLKKPAAFYNIIVNWCPFRGGLDTLKGGLKGSSSLYNRPFYFSLFLPVVLKTRQLWARPLYNVLRFNPFLVPLNPYCYTGGAKSPK